MRICVYCAASNRIPTEYREQAVLLGKGLAERNWSLVYGGGSIGLMGALAETLHAHGGTVVGVIPQGLLEREVGYLKADELIVTTTMRERKQIMDERADAFITLPGGFGTLEELIEIISLRQLHYHDKPIVIVNVSGYFDPLIAQFDRIFDQKFSSPQYRSMYHVVGSAEDALLWLDTALQSQG